MLVLGTITQSNCYAGFVTTITEISVKCSPSQEEAMPQAYVGAPHTYLSLTTKGIKVDEIEELITPKNWDWDSNDALVIARCTVSDGVTNAGGMFSYIGRNWKTPITLECARGEGIEIVMYKPNDSDPNKYQYVADLISDRLVRSKKTQPSSLASFEKIPDMEVVQQSPPIVDRGTDPSVFSLLLSSGFGGLESVSH